ncbi:unnamed protein product [Fusarium graminearum]|uniref:Uncharacterized protein n=1 Tax=Gibberella zeae TaxID=5518 RepID=A0A9N8R5U5_GIBZA|nr:unnamed protein product [Fusarium graminearum]
MASRRMSTALFVASFMPTTPRLP